MTWFIRLMSIGDMSHLLSHFLTYHLTESFKCMTLIWNLLDLLSPIHSPSERSSNRPLIIQLYMNKTPQPYEPFKNHSTAQTQQRLTPSRNKYTRLYLHHHGFLKTLCNMYNTSPLCTITAISKWKGVLSTLDCVVPLTRQLFSAGVSSCLPNTCNVNEFCN